MGREYSAILSYLKLTGQELKNAQRSVCKQGRFLEFLKSIHFGTGQQGCTLRCTLLCSSVAQLNANILVPPCLLVLR